MFKFRRHQAAALSELVETLSAIRDDIAAIRESLEGPEVTRTREDIAAIRNRVDDATADLYQAESAIE